eukprot:3424508-Rhodomonas_salina.1
MRIVRIPSPGILTLGRLSPQCGPFFTCSKLDPCEFGHGNFTTTCRISSTTLKTLSCWQGFFSRSP